VIEGVRGVQARLDAKLWCAVCAGGPDVIISSARTATDIKAFSMRSRAGRVDRTVHADPAEWGDNRALHGITASGGRAGQDLIVCDRL